MATVVCCVFEGDSLTDSGGKYYPMLAAGIANAAVPGNAGFSQSSGFWPFKNGSDLCINRAIGGSRLNTNGATGTGSGFDVNNLPGDLVIRAPVWVDNLIRGAINPPLSKWDNGRPVRKYILSVNVGANDQGSANPAYANAVASYLNARASAGYAGFIVWTIIPRDDGLITLSNSKTWCQTHNAILRGNTWKNSINKPVVIADVGSDATIGESTNAADEPTLITPEDGFPGGVHPTVPTGANLFVPYLTNSMAAIKLLI